MSDPATPNPPKPARSPVERAIVWGVIGIGLIVIAVEAQAHVAHTAAFSKLEAKHEATTGKVQGLTKKDVDQIIGNKTPESKKLTSAESSMGAARVDIYHYMGIVKQRKLYVYYGIGGKTKDQEPEVIDILIEPAESAAEALAKQPPPDPNAPATAPAAMAPAMGGAMGGRGGPGAGPPGGASAPGIGAPGRAPGQPATDAADKGDAGKKPDEQPEAEPKPSETKPAEEKPTEVKDSEEKAPGETPAEEKPADDKPAEPAQPEAATPATDKPAEAEVKKE